MANTVLSKSGLVAREFFLQLGPSSLTRECGPKGRYSRPFGTPWLVLTGQGLSLVRTPGNQQSFHTGIGIEDFGIRRRIVRME